MRITAFFYIDHTGVYRYVLGGSTVEQIIDGSLNSLSSPDTGTVAWGRTAMETSMWAAMQEKI